MAIARGPKGVGYHALLSAGVDIEMLARDIDRLCTASRAVIIPDGVRLAGDRAFNRMVKDAVNAALKLGNDWVGTEHLLLALIDSRDRIARGVLRNAGVRREQVVSFIAKNLKAHEAGGTDRS